MRGQIVSIICNSHNYDQLLVTPNEMVGLYCRDYLLNDPLPFLTVLSLVVGSSQRKQFTCMVQGTF